MTGDSALRERFAALSRHQPEDPSLGHRVAAFGRGLVVPEHRARVANCCSNLLFHPGPVMSSIPFLKSAQPLASGVWLRRSLAWLLTLGMLLRAIPMAQPTQRFSPSANDNAVQTGNTPPTCTGSGCAAAQSGGTSSNQNFTIINVNTDPVGGGAPANSSTGDITLPPGSSVLWAGLYWSGRTATASGDGNGPIQAAARDFWFKVPGGSYQQVTALVADTFTFNTRWQSRLLRWLGTDHCLPRHDPTLSAHRDLQRRQHSGQHRQQPVRHGQRHFHPHQW